LVENPQLEPNSFFSLAKKKMEVRNKVVVILYKRGHLHSNVHKKINSPLISTSLGKNLFTWRGEWNRAIEMLIRGKI
jgi:hypothetical protein